MNSAKYAPPPPHLLTATKRPLWSSSSSSPRCSFSTKRRRSNRRKTPSITRPKRPSLVENDETAPGSSGNLNLVVLDVNQIKSLATSSLNRFLRSADYAYHDLRTLVAVDGRGRVVVSWRRSTVEFAGAVLVYGFVAVFAVRAFAGLVAWLRVALFRGRAGEGVVVRRDRSLGGKEVVVARRVREPEAEVRRKSGSRGSDSSRDFRARGR